MNSERQLLSKFGVTRKSLEKSKQDGIPLERACAIVTLEALLSSEIGDACSKNPKLEENVGRRIVRIVAQRLTESDVIG